MPKDPRLLEVRRLHRELDHTKAANRVLRRTVDRVNNLTVATEHRTHRDFTRAFIDLLDAADPMPGRNLDPNSNPNRPGSTPPGAGTEHYRRALTAVTAQLEQLTRRIHTTLNDPYPPPLPPTCRHCGHTYRRGTRHDAEEWLRQHLTAPTPAVELQRAATVAGINVRTLRRAADRLRVRKVKTGDGWVWHPDLSPSNTRQGH